MADPESGQYARETCPRCGSPLVTVTYLHVGAHGTPQGHRYACGTELAPGSFDRPDTVEESDGCDYAASLRAACRRALDLADERGTTPDHQFLHDLLANIEAEIWNVGVTR